MVAFPFPVILALMMNELKNAHLKKVIQTIVCIPYFLSWVIVGGLFFDLFGAGGLFNNIRNALGMNGVPEREYFLVRWLFCGKYWKCFKRNDRTLH